jgi:chromosomal replication initiator protein
MDRMDHTVGDDQLSQAWAQAVGDLQSRVQQDSAAGIWLPNLQLLGMRDGLVLVGAPNAYQAKYLEANLGRLLSDCLSDALRRTIRASFVVSGGPSGPIAAPPEERAPIPVRAPRRGPDLSSSPLNPRYTFDAFVSGGSNRIAHAAAMSVAHKPGAASTNPLFIYGGVGLGKTHLMHAIGHGVRELHPDLEVVYIGGEAFLQKVVSAIRDGGMDEFRARIREVDVWLMDDIQLIAQREGTRTETEFFFAFNALHEAGRQIVISSDRPPRQLQLLDDRLRSRFESGLTADIARPDKEMRTAILQQRTLAAGVRVADSVLDYIAETIQSSIRALEGALRRLLYTASIDGRPIDLALARECLADFASNETGRALTVALIRSLVAERFGVSERDLLGKTRRKALVIPRQIGMYVARQVTDRPLQTIAREFGRTDHTTVIHACAQTEKMMRDDASLAVIVTEILEQARRSSAL